MEWVATAIAVIAAVFTGWQAWEARRARRDAKQYAVDAQEHEHRAVAASERMAAAAEEQLAVQTRERERYQNPWTSLPVSVKSGRRWRLALGGEEPVTGVRVTVDDEAAHERLELSKSDAETMRPGESMTLSWWRSMASPSQVTAEVHWIRPNGEAHSTHVTLD